MNLNRRRFLQLTGAGLASSHWPMTLRAAAPNNPDVVIVGAGAAGLAAAHQLTQRGISFALLEASGNIGGRAITDTAIFGQPYDLGASWLHNGEQNPLLRYAKSNGFHPYEVPDNEDMLYVGQRMASQAERAELAQLERAAYNAIEAAAEAERDISIAEAVKDVLTGNGWDHVVASRVGTWEMGQDIDRLSVLDWYAQANGKDWLLKDGYGALLSHYGRDLPVHTQTTVEAIDWRGPRVKVKTNQGTLSCQKVLLTVSVGVLAKDKIQFSPALDATKQASFHDLQMNAYNHIALQFDGGLPEFASDTYLNGQFGSEESIGWMLNMRGTELNFGYVGGRFSEALEQAPMNEAIETGLENLASMLGGDIRKRFIKGFFTTWKKYPTSYGSYACARPGQFPARQILQANVGEHIYFAGEACAGEHAATVHGAMISGDNRAREMAEALTG